MDYNSEGFKNWKMSVFYKSNEIWKESYNEKPKYSLYKLKNILEDYYGSDDEVFEDGTALPKILIQYENNLTKIVKLLEKEYCLKHSKGGRKSKLSIEQMLMATVEYFESHKTFKEIAESYHIHESNMYDNIIWVLKTLSKYKILDYEKDKNDGRLYATVNCKKLYFYRILKDA